jgi:hypothetical protein
MESLEAPRPRRGAQYIARASGSAAADAHFAAQGFAIAPQSSRSRIAACDFWPGHRSDAGRGSARVATPRVEPLHFARRGTRSAGTLQSGSGAAHAKLAKARPGSRLERAVQARAPTMLARGAGSPSPSRRPHGGRRRWSETELLLELSRFADAETSLTYDALTAAGRLDLARAVQNFGGLQKLRRAGLLRRPRPSKAAPALDRAALLAEITRRFAAGEPLASSLVPARLLNAGVRHFGNWQSAITGAGIDYEQVRMKPRAIRKR